MCVCAVGFVCAHVCLHMLIVACVHACAEQGLVRLCVSTNLVPFFIFSGFAACIRTNRDTFLLRLLVAGLQDGEHKTNTDLAFGPSAQRDIKTGNNVLLTRGMTKHRLLSVLPVLLRSVTSRPATTFCLQEE